MTYRITEGDALERLVELDAGSVQTCITSPPYWGLRDYGTATWDGGDAECDHIRTTQHDQPESRPKGWDGSFRNTSRPLPIAYAGVCGKCGATRIDSQLGLEPTPEEYIANMVEVFRAVRRVLRDDGTLWLNLGDSYAGSAATGEKRPGSGRADGVVDDRAQRNRNGLGAVPGLKPKDLVGIPWMVAFALRADGWYLRSDIIWAKPNPMPESVTDRPTKAHEYLFLLSKSPRYFYDADAIREPLSEISRSQIVHYEQNGERTDKRDKTLYAQQSRPDDLRLNHKGAGARGAAMNPAGANKRSVWTVTTQPFPGAHFATFPPKLIEPCVLAGSPPKCCGECGAPRERVVEVDSDFTDRPGHPTRYGDTETMSAKGYGMPSIAPPTVTTTGWRSTCTHDDDSGTSTVLDPFAGAGTTGVVALRNNRSFVGIELNPDYARMARNRIHDDGPLFNVEAVDG